MSLNDKIKEFRNEIKKSKKPIMFFDTDTDGVTSYLQLKNKYKKLIGYPMPKEFEYQKKIANNILLENDLVIIFDVALLSEDFIKMAKDKKIIWADHHITQNDKLAKKYNINYLNPLDFNKNDNRPCTYLAYLIAKTKKNLPLVTLGSISDFFLLDIIPQLYKYNKKEFNALLKLDDEKRKELFKFIKKHSFNDEESADERNNWIRYLTYDAKVIDIKNLIDFFFKLKNDEDIQLAIKKMENIDLQEIKGNINSEKGFPYEEYAQLMKKYREILKKALAQKHDGNLFLFEYSGKKSYTKTISEEICYRFQNTKVIAICFTKNNSLTYSCSFRGNNYNVNNLVNKALEGLDGRGGGHPFAAGVRINKDNYETFKEKIKQLTNNTKNL